MRRAVAILAIACAAGLVAVTLSYSLFDRAPAGERVTDSFRATLSSKGFPALEANFNALNRLGTQFVGEAVPAFARDLGMSGGQFNRFVAANFPAVAKGVREIPPALAFVAPVIPRLGAIHGDFNAVDDIPGLGLPISSVPWMLIALAVALLLLGLAGLRARGPGPTAAILLLGIGMVAVPLALSLPHKAQAAARVVPVGEISVSARAAATATEAVKVTDALVTEVQTKMVPALAARLHRTPAQLRALIARDYPNVAHGLAGWPSIKPSAAALAANQRARVHDVSLMKGTPFRALPWFVIAPGILLTLFAGVALLAGSRSRPAGRVPVD